VGAGELAPVCGWLPLLHAASESRPTAVTRTPTLRPSRGSLRSRSSLIANVLAVAELGEPDRPEMAAERRSPHVPCPKPGALTAQQCKRICLLCGSARRCRAEST